MQILTDVPLTLCDDCGQIAANGVDAHDPEQKDHLLRMIKHTPHWRGSLVVHTDSHRDFETGTCDGCDTGLAGGRWTASLIGG